MGFPIDDEKAFVFLLEAVHKRMEYEEIMSEAVYMFLSECGFRDLRHAAEEMDCPASDLVDLIAVRANLMGKPH